MYEMMKKLNDLMDVNQIIHSNWMVDGGDDDEFYSEIYSTMKIHNGIKLACDSTGINVSWDTWEDGASEYRIWKSDQPHTVIFSSTDAEMIINKIIQLLNK